LTRRITRRQDEQEEDEERRKKGGVVSTGARASRRYKYDFSAAQRERVSSISS
jgi:hypothetical protein